MEKNQRVFEISIFETSTNQKDAGKHTGGGQSPDLGGKNPDIVKTLKRCFLVQNCRENTFWKCQDFCRLGQDFCPPRPELLPPPVLETRFWNTELRTQLEIETARCSVLELFPEIIFTKFKKKLNF